MHHSGKDLVALRNYLEKQNYPVFYSAEPVHPELNFCVCIPCFNEPEIEQTLLFLQNANRPVGAVEIIVVVNDGENDPLEIKEQNKKTYAFLKKWQNKNNKAGFRLLVDYRPALPKKIAGAGFARKIAMDTAISRFYEAQNPNGVILSLDADSLVHQNYFSAIESHFKNDELARAASIYFEHPLSGTKFSNKIYQAIALYELYLRYYKNLLRFSGFPNAYYTVGSAFACRANSYVKIGGMNRKKAGEDFYFLHKLIPDGNFAEINSTCVYPSPRPSNRVPFGTGPEIIRIISRDQPGLEVYHPDSLREIKRLFRSLEETYQSDSPAGVLNQLKISEMLLRFLEQEEFEKHLLEIKNNSGTYLNYRKRFFKWFNAFFILKYLNFAHQKQFSKMDVGLASAKLFDQMKIRLDDVSTNGLLQTFRHLDRGGKLL